VLFAVLGRLGLDILLRDINPVSHAALCDALEKKQLVLGAPVRAEERELQIVEDDKSTNCLWCRIASRVANGHPCAMAFQANNQGFA